MQDFQSYCQWVEQKTVKHNRFVAVGVLLNEAPLSLTHNTNASTFHRSLLVAQLRDDSVRGCKPMVYYAMLGGESSLT